MRFIDRLYIFVRRKFFQICGVSTSQIGIQNPRLFDLVSENSNGSFNIKETIVHVQSGTSFVQLGREAIMLDESSTWHPIVAQNYFGIKPDPNAIRKVVSNRIVIANPRNYFHWFTEELIRYQSVDRSLQFIAHKSLPAYARTSLDGINIELEYLDENWIQIKDQLLFPRKPFEELRLKGEYSQLGRKVKDSIPYCPCHGEMNNSKVYISRRNSKRPLPNEIKVEKTFKEIGFEIMYFETLDFPCQVSITRGLKILAGSHGAGLTNMLWSQTNSRIIEVMPPDFHNPCYRQLAQNLGLEYDCIDLLNRILCNSKLISYKR